LETFCISSAIGWEDIADLRRTNFENLSYKTKSREFGKTHGKMKNAYKARGARRQQKTVGA